MKEQGVYQQLRSHLAYLRLTAVSEQLAPALERAGHDKPSYTRFLERLLTVEVEATERRKLEGRLRFASLPSPKTLAEIDYDGQPALDRKLVGELATLRFVAEHSNVLLIGSPGVGKTMLAVALAAVVRELNPEGRHYSCRNSKRRLGGTRGSGHRAGRVV
jgi:DNA replication protein DnaC